MWATKHFTCRICWQHGCSQFECICVKKNPIDMKFVTKIVHHQCKFRVHDGNLNA
jgi:recombinational DNA repair protein RecR